MSKLSPEEMIELNNHLKRLRKILPDIIFRYSEESGILEGLVLKIENDPLSDINFYSSVPRYTHSQDLLRKSVKQAWRREGRARVNA
jgi:hypothetical protein